MAPHSARKIPVQSSDRPLLQWVMAGLGALATLGVIGIVLWEALQPASPPKLHARIVGIAPAATGFTAEVEVLNDGADTAASVNVVGQLGAATPSTATVDYVPGRGRATVWLQFDRYPQSASVAVVGWSEP